jgi:hypothetical protein
MQYEFWEKSRLLAFHHLERLVGPQNRLSIVPGGAIFHYKRNLAIRCDSIIIFSHAQ